MNHQDDEARMGMTVTADGNEVFCKYRYVVEKLRKNVCCSGTRPPSQMVHALMARAAEIEEIIAQKNKEDAECIR